METVALIAVVALAAPQGQIKKIPAKGIAIPAKDRKELEAGVARLGAALKALERSPKKELLPDIEVYHKAVDWALRYDEFFAKKDIAAAKEILKEGLARASALKEGRAPWTTATGLVVRGYRSILDGSVQPYGLVIPETWKAGSGKKLRLDVWLHGRNEKLSEVNFIADRRKSRGQFTPPDTIVLHAYGRYCNAFKFAGEVDVLEGMTHVQEHYPVDANRFAIRGFSMGGAGVWHLAAHMPEMWAVAAPGAGFAETARYQRVDPAEVPWYERKLWHLYDATDYAANLSRLTTVAYSGEDDKQIQAARVMAEAMKAEGLDLVHVIGPKTGHKYEPGAKKEVARRVDAAAVKGRPTGVRNYRHTTWTMRYPGSRTMPIRAMEKHWKRARLEVTFPPDGPPIVKTENVRVFEFLKRTHPSITIDGQVVKVAGVPLFFTFASGRWVQSDAVYGGKTAGLHGPIDDAFMGPFIFVRPTGRPQNPETAKWIEARMNRAIADWRSFFRGDARVVDDRDLTEEQIRDHNIVLWGDPGSNRVLARISKELPITWDAKQVTVGGRTHPAATHVPVYIHPFPGSPRYVVINTGFTFAHRTGTSNSWHTPALPDWAVLDVTRKQAGRYVSNVADAGFFDEAWKVDPARK